MILEKARAKINLTLDVGARRPDGYHELESVMHTIDLCDFVTLADADEGIEISVNVPFVPRDQRNIAHRAAVCLMQRIGVQRGVRIDIDKRIPIAAGLAGGSADGAAVLRGLNQLWDLGLTTQDLVDIAAEVGSDVPFCVEGGCAIARGRGERLERVSQGARFWIVLVKPPLSVSTADVYAAFDAYDGPPAPAGTAAVRELLDAGRLNAVMDVLSNGLEPVTCLLYPEVARLRDLMERLAGRRALMSGSGPTVFVPFVRESRARKVFTELRSLYKEAFLCQTC